VRNPVLTEGSGLLETSMQVIAGWFESDEQHVPFEVSTAGRFAGENLIEVAPWSCGSTTRSLPS